MKPDAVFNEARSNADLPPCLTVVMPVYNEMTSVAAVVRMVLEQRPVQELIIVDDASRDDTWEALQEFQSLAPRVKLIRHDRNQGKGAALRTGFSLATAHIVIVQDADFEYDPHEYYLLLKPILTGKAQVVFGTRFGSNSAHRVLYFWHSVGNRLLTTLSNICTNLNLSDMETCYKAFRHDVLKGITIEESRFGFEPEITAKVGKLRVPIYEVAISYYGRTYEEGKKIGWRDGFSALRCIFKYNLLR
jgi:glycosyltransferase involved in cell wall biosynthesis